MSTVSAPPPSTFIIVDNDDTVRDLWQGKLAREPDFTCVGTFASAECGLRWLEQHGPPDIVLVDWKLPGMNGGKFIQTLKAAHPRTHALVITCCNDLDTMLAAFAAGAEGYIQKPGELAELPRHLRDLLAGRAPLSIQVGKVLLARLTELAPLPVLALPLSPQECRVLDLLAEGHGDKQVSDRLGLSIHTVNSYKRRLFEKLHVHSATEAVARGKRYRR